MIRNPQSSPTATGPGGAKAEGQEEAPVGGVDKAGRGRHGRRVGLFSPTAGLP
jgi:hypothetical protein